MSKPMKSTAIAAEVLGVLLGSAESIDALMVSKQVSGFRPTTYATLIQLEDSGWVESEWEPAVGGGVRRRLYRLTPGGRRAAARTVAEAAATSRRKWPSLLKPVPTLRTLPALLRGLR